MNCNDPLFRHVSAAQRAVLSRRTFLQRSSTGLGIGALGSLLNPATALAAGGTGLPGLPHLPEKAKRIIYLFQSGAPSQMDLFDPKPQMEAQRSKDLPASIRQGQSLTTMTSGNSEGDSSSLLL